MNKNLLYPILLLCTLFLGESYNIFGTVDYNPKSWFILIDLKQDAEWYIKDSAEGLIWIIFLFVWHLREKKRSPFWADLILMFCIFRIVDLGVYWLNHRHKGVVYCLPYLSILIYGFCIIRKHCKR